MQTTREVAARISATKFAEFAPDVIAYSKTLTLSALGAMIAGAARTSGQIMTRYVTRAGGNPEATVTGTTLKTNVETAAMANATFAHSTEYEDDSFPEAVSSYTIFPAVLALGEHLRSSGPEIIEAFVVGYEMQSRIGLACQEARRRGMLTLSWAGTLGCAAAAAKLLKLDVQRTTMALSLAASQCSGIAHQVGTSAHTFEMGISGRNGLTSALLAADGFTGQPDIFEAPRGLFHILNGGKIPTTEDVLGNWGRPYRLLEIGIKMYPCCYHLQRIIEAIVKLKQEHHLAARDITEVQVEVNLFIPQVIQYPEPGNEDEVQFSLPHAVAAALLEDKISPRSFSDEKLRDESFKEMRQKVKMVVREEWGWATIGWSPIITVSRNNGEKLTTTLATARGQPPNILDFDEVVEKYRICTEGRLGAENVHRTAEMIRALESCQDISEIIRAANFRVPAAQPHQVAAA
jgi:2-methylcitrate dehydratase PrpD